MDTPASTIPSRSSARTTLAIGAVVAAVAILFAFESAWYGHWYALFRVVHVGVAVFWVGGGILITVLGLRAERADDPNEVVMLARWAAWVGSRLFAPAGGVVLLAGIALMINTNWGWGRFWIVIGLLGYAATMVTGMAFLSPQAKRIEELSAANGPTAPETLAAIRKILLVARVDVAVLLLVVIDMVTKPFS